MGRLSASGYTVLYLSVCWLQKLMLSHGVFVCCVTEILKCIQHMIVISIVIIPKELLAVLVFVLFYFFGKHIYIVSY